MKRLNALSNVQSLPRLLALTFALATCACSPKVYVVDRQTALEEEAAGQWPQFEKDLMRKSAATEPTPYEQVPVNARKKRLYNVLNGEMSSTAVTAQATSEAQPAREAKP